MSDVEAGCHPASPARGPAAPGRIAGWLALWFGVALVAIFQHGPVPMYSTRTLAVAWEMWQRHSFLVPYLNGAPYSDKVPLLYWLIHAGWAITGVGDGWPRLLEVLLGGLQLVLCLQLARRLFPDRPAVAYAAPLLLMSFSYAFEFGLQSMYEVLLADCVLAALLALRPGPGEARPHLPGFAVALALGLLAKGPVMLLHAGLPWLFGPLWQPWAARHRGRWYGTGAIAVLAALAVLLAWALSASAVGGEAYRQQLLFHQTAGRVVDAFAHRQPFWWYLPVLPMLVFPFVLWPRPWLGMAALPLRRDDGLRFLVAWLAPVLLGFSLVSGKQAYYLLPEFAGFALLLAAALAHAPTTATRRLGPWPLALFTLLLGIGLLALPTLVARGMVHSPMLQSFATHSRGFGVGFVLLTALLATRGAELEKIVLTALLGALAINTLFTLTWWHAFDLRDASAVLARAEADGRPIFNNEGYNGQFTFAGRLTRPIDEAAGPVALHQWASAHPQGVVVTYPKTEAEARACPALHVQRFRGVWLAIRPAAAYLPRAAPPCP
ncbi:MAG: glycosyltransferase family 39 protein [Xanthomonadaceae bacterium]|nr:glycosyltransferase family 39 protein [Xanthomonadaceae bacterium]